MANIRSFPNNQDEYIGAEEVMRWHHGRSSGVFGADEKAAVAPVLDTMAVTVSDGIGWLTNDEGNGVVWWVDNEAKDGSKLQLSIDIADAVLPRIDRVVVSWQTTNYVALPEVIILKGTPASNPVAPALTNDSVVRQISLAAIRIPAGATSIDAYMITDERLDESVCGIVTEKVGVDTSVMKAQFDSFWAKNIADFEVYKANEIAAFEAYKAGEIADFEAYMALQKAAWEAFLANSEQDGIIPVPAPADKGKAVVVNENGDGYTLANPSNSYIIHGTVDHYGTVTLTNFDWDELREASESTENIYVAMRLTGDDNEIYVLPLTMFYQADERAVFSALNRGFFQAVQVEFDGSVAYKDTYPEIWTFTLEDGSTVTKAVYVG